MVKSIFIKFLSVLVLFSSFYTATASAKRRHSKYRYEIKGVVNINKAPWYKLRLLPGIGMKKAKAIVKYRQQHKFGKKYELKRIKGIGKKLYSKIKKYVVLTGTTNISRKKVLRSLK